MKLRALSSGLAAIVIIAMLAVLSVPTAVAHQPAPATGETRVFEHVVNAQIPFIENQGQVQQESVRFYAQTFGGTLFVEDGGTLTYCIRGEEGAGVVIREGRDCAHGY